MTTTAKRTLGMIAAVLIVVGALAALKYHSIHQATIARAAAKPPPVTVAAINATETTWQRQLHAPGNLTAAQGVTVSNELAGSVAKIDFESGQHVQQGDLLVQLDVSTDEAQLRGFEAQADLGKISLQRARELHATNANPQSDLDSAEAQYKQAVANVDNQRAVIAKKTIRAPFTGRVGIRQINLGQYLASGSEIVTLQAFDPIYVNFYLPEQDITDLRTGQAIRIAVEAYPGTTFTGEISAVNAKVDDATHNVQVQATLRNADERLVPGMFATADVVLPRQDKFVTVPETAIVYNPYGNAVYVIEKPAGTGGADPLIARQRFVQLGETRGDQVAVVKGVQVGDEIVTAGQLKLRNGSPVRIDNTVQLSSNPAPQPPNT